MTAPFVADAEALRAARCECPFVAEEPRYHGGEAAHCPREAAQHVANDGTPIITSPALCMACLHGCYE